MVKKLETLEIISLLRNDRGEKRKSVTASNWNNKKKCTVQLHSRVQTLNYGHNSIPIRRISQHERAANHM